MYSTHYGAVSTLFKRRTNNWTKVHVKDSVDMTEREILIENWFIRVCSVCDLECCGLKISAGDGVSRTR